MAFTIDNLEIQIQAEAKKASGGLDKLAKSLEALKSAVGSSSGLASNLTQIAGALEKFSKIPKLNISITSIATSLGKLRDVARTLNVGEVAIFSSQMKTLADGLSHLSGVGKGQFTSVVNSLKKIPDITKSLDTETLDAFASKMERLTTIMDPLASKMDAVARGFNALPKSVLRALNATNKQTQANNKLSKSYGGLFTNLSRTAARFWTLYYSVSRITDVFSDWFSESNEYTESLNLFNVSLGEAADGAMRYAEAVSDAMGIDIAEWITNQGTFTRMSTGFGIVADQAELMGQNLTQLAYDMSSFFNVDVETAMQKLQSGMSGQIKGLKAWGYNLSVAALQETALSLGIEQSVRTMTEAQKAQLRYITLIQKSNGIMGDMAKTIQSPSNALRVLKAQLTEMRRALGNVVSVLVTKFIPWIMAAVELVAEFADTLAKAWGFEVMEFPEVDLDLGAEVEEEVDQAEDALKELKKQLMGFDELNILKSDKDEFDEISYDLGIDLPEYDFMKGLNKIDLEPYKDELREIFELAKNIGGAFLLWKIATGVHDFIKLFATSTVATNISDFVENFHLFRMEAGYDTWDSLCKSFKELWDKIPKVTKAIIGAGALISAFALAKKGAKDLVEALNSDSNKGLGGAIAELVGGVAFGAVGGAMIGGPIGALIGALGTLAFEILGVLEAQEDLRVEMSLTDYYDNQGTSLDTLRGYLKDYFRAMDFDKQEKWRKAIKTAQENYDEAKDSYSEMYDTIKSKNELDTTEIDGLTEAIDALAQASIALNDANLGAVMGSIKTAIDRNITSNLTEQLSKLNNEILIAKQLLGEKIGNLQTESSAIINDIRNSGGKITDEQREKLNHLTDQIDKFTLDSLTQQEIDREKYLKAEGKYNLGSNKTEVLKAVQTLKSDQEELVEMLEDQFMQDKHTLEQLIKMNKENKWGLNLSKSDITALEQAKNEAIKEVNEKYKEVFEAIATNYESDARWNDKDFNGYYKKSGNAILDWNLINLGGQIIDWFKPGDLTGDSQIVWEQLELLKAILKIAGYTESQINSKFKTWGIPGYASGGFPTLGSLFYAHENGVPELVGRIGNKTAVANNDQITQGIATAVYNAMMAAQSDGSGDGGTNARIIVQIGERAVGEAAVRFINGQVVQTGSSPLYAL